ncbi:phosphopantetheine-binding protein [Kibdelosporangium aridum]|uniref:Phosphopantetheine attachment site n=1 Tax=Kibdelosporangium aridum TaxID=2030 RepID=A0A1W2FM34_KIBAR|nr:phosphopantetheine-binding protein [Kibdelosporangium aridum]SMD22991.1 Phosphopantetheine attachment site [Kibdelosporangium aridum]
MRHNEVHAIVADTAAQVLGVQPGTGTLTDLPTFNSFRLVEILERVETRLGVTVDPADLTPDNLTRIDSLCAMFERSLREGAVR